MVEHIGEHLLIGCNIAIPRVKKGENLLSLEVKMEKNPALPLSQTRPCCSSPSQVSHCRWFLFAHALLALFPCAPMALIVLAGGVVEKSGLARRQ